MFKAIRLGNISASGSGPQVIECLDVSPVWSGHPVGFTLLTHPPYQYVAYYDDKRRMMVASRTLDRLKWHYAKLPESVGWDSHNFVTMTIDDEGYLHLSGNMHSVPLIYFRTSRPHDIDSFMRIPSMVGIAEDRCTYPHFFRGADDELIFTYRDGGSGDGDQIYNVYDHGSKTWRRLLDKPLMGGKGERNAYLHGPKRGPDGFFHLCWVWRETWDCLTNHDPSYARSRDLVHWETSDGTELDLPITLKTGEIIDSVPIGGGILNGNVVLGFDSQNRPVISYHKCDAKGFNQIYNARREKDGWEIYLTSDWQYRWDFKGGGAIPFGIRINPVKVESKGRLSQSYNHVKYGSGTWLLDEETFKILGELPRPPAFPADLERVQTKFPGMRVTWSGDRGGSEETGVRYIMRWETLDANRDGPREEPYPPPSMLRLYKLGVSELKI